MVWSSIIFWAGTADIYEKFKDESSDETRQEYSSKIATALTVAFYMVAGPLKGTEPAWLSLRRISIKSGSASQKIKRQAARELSSIFAPFRLLADHYQILECEVPPYVQAWFILTRLSPQQSYKSRYCDGNKREMLRRKNLAVLDLAKANDHDSRPKNIL